MIMGVHFQGLNRLCVVVSKQIKQNTFIPSSVFIVDLSILIDQF